MRPYPTLSRAVALLGVGLALLVLLSPAPLYAQTSQDYFLHGSGGTANPPTLFLDTTASTSGTAKYKDSASVNFTGGNPWQVVGTWPTSPVPASGTLVAIAPTHVWLGLKNSDDQGTNFDLLVELYKNGTLVSSGLNRCLTGITRNPTSALEATVSLSAPSPQPLNGTSDTLSLKVWTRIGTNPDNTMCAGHSNAVGLRLYFDATANPSRVGLTITPNPIPTTLAPNPLTITVGATGTLTATLAPAPTADGTLAVSSANTSLATVPATVAFVSGQTSVPIPVTAVAVGTTQITASLNGGSASATVQVTPAPPTITSLSPTSLNLTQGATGTLTVTISSAQLSDTVVTLSSTAAGIASVPSSVTVPAGQISAPVTVTANTPGTVQITAALNSTSASSMVTVAPAQPTIVSLLPPTNPVTLGGTVTLTVSISATQPTDTVIAVSASPSGIVTVPASVTVLAGHLNASITVGTVALGTAMVHVSLNGSAADATVQVTPPPPAVVSLTPSPLTVVVNATGQLTVTLNAAQSINTQVTLTVDNPSLLQVPASVTVPLNQLQATFTVTGLAVGDALVTAAVGSSSRSATVHVIPPPPVPVSLLPNPLPLQQGATGSLTLTISSAQVSDTVVPLTNSDATIIQAPSSITVPAGQTSAAVPVTALVPGSATVSATLNGTTVSSTVQVTAPPPVVTSLTPATLSLPKGKPGVLRVTVSRAPTAPTPVALTSGTPSVATVPASVTIPAGALFADFPVMSLSEGSAIITASLNGGSAQATVTVTPAEVVSLTLTPTNPSLFVGESQPFTATGTFTDGTTQNLTSTVTWTSETATVATINSGGVATALAVGTTTITASYTNPSGPPPVTASTTLTVNPPPQMQLIPSSANVQIGETISLTLDAGAPANAGGLTVTLSQNGTGTVTIPATVTVPEGQQTVPVLVTGATAGSVTLTASAIGRLSATATLTVTPGVPSITSFSPLTGPVGTTVTLTGTSFHAVASENTVKFNGTTAIITSVTSTGTQLVTTVPQGATTGPITVTTAQGTGTSAQNFTVTGPDFTISALPTPLTIASTGQSAFAVSLNGTGGFTNLATLSVTGVPAGMTATFSAATLTMGQSAFLTLTTTGTTAAGTYPLTVNATGLVNGTQTTRSATANVQVGAAGATTLSGQVLDEDANPVKNALVTLGTLQVSTDDGGNFLMQNPPAGTGQLLLIDGGPASTPAHNLPIIPYKVTIVAGQNNTLGFTPKLHFQKTTGMVDISNSTVQRIVTDPDIPGFQMTIPAGATIIGWDGQPNGQVSVRRVPIDRTPLPPLPAGGIVPAIYMDYFGKPGGGTPSEPIPITLPNDAQAPPGSSIELWYYDEAPDGSRPNQWAQFGTGTVSADGSQVIPDINPATGKPYGQPRFCCGGVAGRSTSKQGSGKDGSTGGEPVDLATGFFLLAKTDLVLPGRLPVVFTRTFRTDGPLVGPFSTGTSHSYNMQLEIQNGGRTLVLPDGRRFLFPLQLDGTYRNTVDPAYRGAVLTPTGSGHTLRFNDGLTWTFGPLGTGFGVNTAFLDTITDRNGNTITLTRTGVDRLLSTITDPAGRQITLTYTVVSTPAQQVNAITALTDPLGRTVQYGYDSQGRLATVTDPLGAITRYTYDSAGRMTTITDPRGLTYLTNEYDSAGRVSRQTLADSGVWQFAYTVTGGVVTSTTVTDPDGHLTVTRFDGQGYTLGRTDGNGQASTLTRQSATNLVASRTDALGRTTRYTYDAAGNVLTITDPANQTTTFAYEPTFNRVTQITDALTQITSFTYDANGNLLTTTDPLNHVTTIAYNQFGQPTSVQGPIPSEPPTAFAYDANGNLITTTDPLGNVTQRAYDAVSRLSTLTDPRGLSTLFRYDGLNRVIEIADASQGLTHFSYDPNGNLLTVQDAKNQTTTYTYDNLDRLATRKDALGRQESYQYDVAGNLTRFTDRKNQQSTFTYDSLNRRTGASYQDGSNTSFVYDSVGRLAKATDSIAGTIEFSYDSLDRLSQETTPQGTVMYQYDALGRRTQMAANGQSPVAYQYDAASRLTQVAQGTQVVGLGYDNANRRTSLTYPNGTNTSYTHDNASRLTNIVHNGPSGIIESLAYTYDAAGNRISLMRANGAVTNLPAAVQAAYDATNEQIQFNSASPNQTFDANGNLTNDGTNTYTWDARNRLTSISGGVTANFSYDALGRRVSKTINGVTTSYLYDGKDIMQEIGGSAVGASYVRSLNIDEPFVRQTSTGNEFYHVDALGSTLDLTNQAGAVQVSYQYEAFGKTTMTGTSSNPFQYTGRENDGTGLYYYRARYHSPQLERFLSEDQVLVPFTPLSVGLCRLRNDTIWTLPAVISRPRSGMSQYVNAYLYAYGSPILSGDSSGLCSYLNQITKCSSDGRGDPTPLPGQPGITVGACIGTEVESIGGSSTVGGKKGNCKEGYKRTKDCINKDHDQFVDFCSANGQVPLPPSCTSQFKACIKQDNDLK